MTYGKSIFWLKIACYFTIAMGLLIAASAVPALSGPAMFFVDFMFYPLDGAQNQTSQALRLASAICGGEMVGWGVLSYQLATRLLEREPALVRSFILTSLSCWFVIDSTASIAAGAWMNVGGNVIFLLAFVLPVWRIPVKNEA